MEKASQPDLLRDNPWKLMRQLSLPGILGMMVISINALIDSIYLGNLVGPDAFAGVSLLFPLTLVVTSATVFIATGSSSVLSRAIGKKDEKIQRKVIPNLITLSLIFSGLLMVVGLVFAEELVGLLGATDAIHQAGVEYFSTYLWGMFFSIYGLSANGLIRAEGKIRQAMRFTMVAVAVNIFITPLFISTFKLGIAGAAWSSIVAMTVYSILTSLYFVRDKASFSTGKFSIGIEQSIMRDMAHVGFSAFLMQISNVIRQFIVFRSVTWYGTAHDVVFFSAAFRLFSFMAIPAMGLLQPLQPIVGINYGASNWDRCIDAVKVFGTGAVGLLLLFLIPLMIFPESFIHIMIPDETLTYQDIDNLRLIMMVLPVIPIASSSIIFFQSIGKGKIAGMLPIIRQVALFLPLIWLLPQFMSLKGIYYSLAIENILYAIGVWVFARQELKKLQPVERINTHFG